MGKSRKQYDKNFKLRTVELSYEDRSITSLAQELGISVGLIYRWRSELSANRATSFPGQGKASISPEDTQIALLRKELSDKEQELEILKKAMGLFSRRDFVL